LSLAHDRGVVDDHDHDHDHDHVHVYVYEAGGRLLRPYMHFLLCSVLVLSTTCPADDKPAPPAGPTLSLAIVQPGYPGSPDAAADFLADLSAYLEKQSGAKGLAASYHNVPREALDAIARERPALSVVSLGFYLEHRKSLRLKPRLEARPQLRLTLVAPRGGARTIEDLAGKPVGGGALYELDFLARVAFARPPEAAGASPGPNPAVRGWKAEPSVRFSRVLRDLEQGKLKAAVFNSRELASLESLGRMKNLEKIAASEYYPPALLVVFDPRADKEDADQEERARCAESSKREESVTEKLVAVFRGIAKDVAAKDLMETMGCEEFAPVRAPWLEELEKRYDRETLDVEKK
jgi:hypothetical protein